MFETKNTLTARLTDAVDLLIDFATLGEYGMEPVAPRRDCEVRRYEAPGRGTRSRGSHRARGRSLASPSR